MRFLGVPVLWLSASLCALVACLVPMKAIFNFIGSGWHRVAGMKPGIPHAQLCQHTHECSGRLLLQSRQELPVTCKKNTADLMLVADRPSLRHAGPLGLRSNRRAIATISARAVLTAKQTTVIRPAVEVPDKCLHRQSGIFRIARVALQLSPLVQDPEHWKEAFTVTQDVEQPDGPITDPQLLNAVRPLLFSL